MTLGKHPRAVRYDEVSKSDGGQAPAVDSHGLSASHTVVAGLRWDPEDASQTAGAHADLDLSCVLLDAHGQVAECIHPGRTRTADGSVLHTGNSRTGAGDWDDERVFVFLNALPETVSAVAVMVTSVTPRRLGDARNASCHLTNHTTERELYRMHLKQSGAKTVDCVATLSRASTGWQIVSGARSELEMQTLVDCCRSHCTGG